MTTEARSTGMPAAFSRSHSPPVMMLGSRDWRPSISNQSRITTIDLSRSSPISGHSSEMVW